MGLDSSNREIPNVSNSQSGSVSPSTFSLNHTSQDKPIRRGSSNRLRGDHLYKKRTSQTGNPGELEMGGEGLKGSEGGGQEKKIGLDDSDDEPSSKPLNNEGLDGQKGGGGLRRDSAEESSDESDTSSSTLERAAPDGGWGWVVVAAAFIINLVADGVTFSFGIYYAEFTKVFKQSKSATAWIGSLLAAMPLLSGPIASSLTDRYGCRRVTIAGSLLSSLGFILSSFADSIQMLYITFGMITGFGLSLCYVAAVVSVAYYFEQRRSLATGISVCGGGIGTFIFAPLTQLLIDKYGWRDATRVLAIPFLYLSICGIVMRDLEWTKKSRRSRKWNNSPSLDSSVSREITASQPRRLYSSAICIPTFLQEQERHARRASRIQIPANQVQRRQLSESHVLSSYPLSNNVPSPIRSDSRQKIGSREGDNPITDDTTQAVNFVTNEGSNNGTPIQSHRQSTTGHSTTPFIHSNALPPSQSQSAMNSSPGTGIHRHSLTYRGAVVSLKRYRLRPASSCPDIISVATTEQSSHEWKAVVSDVCKWCRALFEWRSLSCSRKFILFVISNFLLYMWYDVVYIYLQDSAMQENYSEEKSSYLISILGLFNMVGNLALGYMGDKEYIDATLVYGICMILCGFSVIMLPTVLASSYVPLALDCGLYGLTIAANYSLTSVILVKVVSLERFATAYGLLLLIQGIGNLVGPPIAGLIYDYTATSSWSFWVAGVGILLSSVFILIPKIFKRCSNEGDEEDMKDEVKA